MALTAADLAHHIVTLRKLYARVLEADIELLRPYYAAPMARASWRKPCA